MDLFEVGEIVKIRGLQGGMKVVSFLEAVRIFPTLNFIYIEDRSEQKKLFAVKNIDVAGDVFFMHIENVTTVESAKPFIGRKLYLPKTVLNKLPEGEYYYHDIIGLDVRSEQGDHIGVIEAVLATGSNDVYVCKSGGREILLPAISQVIKKIDLERHVMTINLLEGL